MRSGHPRAFLEGVKGGRLPALCAVALVALGSCAGVRRWRAPSIPPEPHALEARGDSHLRSRALDIALAYREGGSRRKPFALIRVTNRTRAPIYPRLDQILQIETAGATRKLALSCDRGSRRYPRLAPRDALWCPEFANPGYSIDLPLALPEAPPPGDTLVFDLVVPIVFDEGAPVEIRFGNRVSRGDWKLTLPAAPAGATDLERVAGEDSAAR